MLRGPLQYSRLHFGDGVEVSCSQPKDQDAQAGEAVSRSAGCVSAVREVGAGDGDWAFELGVGDGLDMTG